MTYVLRLYPALIMLIQYDIIIIINILNMLLGKLFGLGVSNTKDRSDSANRTSSIGGPAVTTVDPRTG